MAATRLIALHINKGKTVAQCLADRTDYSENAAKTEDGKYISAYACDAKTCDEEFLLSKRQYEHITGRTQAHDVIAYQIRQSFKPGEITPEEANKVGYETAMRFTKGKHAFIVATHVDRAHIHNHIIFNSTTLDCTRKFRDFRLSGLALARLSDIICLEHRLSVIIRKPYGERQKRTEYPEKKSQRDEICEAIDAALARNPKDFRELIEILQEAGYEYKDGKQPALRGKGHARFARFRSFGKGYSVEELCEVLAGNAIHKSKFAEKTRTSARSAQVHQKAELSFLIDVRAKMQAGKGAGYARWAKVFNLKQMAKAMMFMEEHGIKSYAELKEKADGISEKCDALLESVKADEERMSEVSVLRKHLINYAKTKDVFAAYKASGYDREFYEAHRDMLALRSAAKKAFDAYKKENGSDKKLPRMGYEFTTENIQTYLNDVAGVRIVCAFIDDIYMISDLITQQDDIKVIEIKDYIKNPKSNGYRSYHMIVEIPVFFAKGKTPMRVELQIRTNGMDFWATLEHQLRYKKGIEEMPGYDEISEELLHSARAIIEADNEMQRIKDKIGMFYEI